MNNRNNADKRITIFRISFVLFLISAVVLVICIFSRPFAEMYSRTVSAFFRYVLSVITGFFSFSLAEILLCLLPVLWLSFEIVSLIKGTFRFKSLLKRLSSVIFVLFFVFVNTFGVCYTRRPLEDNMGFSTVEFSNSTLLQSAEYIKGELEKTADNINFDEIGASINPHDWKTLNEKIDEGYDRLIKEYSFISDIDAISKPILISPLMTYTHISGIYIPFTGEANVNTNYPDYVVAFSMAHEKAHQRGISGEDESNFIAFLSCLASQDEYLVYCALLSMYDYYLDTAYKADGKAYINLLQNTDKRILGEMYAYSVFFDKYRDSTASKVADSVNDSYIKTMGDDGGIESYGRVVELCTSYLIQKEALPY